MWVVCDESDVWVVCDESDVCDEFIICVHGFI